MVRYSPEPSRPLALDSHSVGATAMRTALAASSIVPFGADQTIYLVVDRLVVGSVAPRDTSVEREIERLGLEEVLGDLLAGRFQDPIRIVAFNTLEHWSKDISTDIADELLCRCDSDGLDPPPYLASFMEAHLGRPQRTTRPSRA